MFYVILFISLLTSCFSFILAVEERKDDQIEILREEKEPANIPEEEDVEIEIVVGSSDIPVLPSSSKEEKKSEKSEIKKSDKPLDKKPESPHKFTGTVGFFSDYRSRGISDTMRQPCIQGELKYSHKSGFYFRNWASNVDGTGNFITNTSMEWDIYIGFLNNLFHTKIEYEVGIEIYYYPGGQARVPGRVGYDTVEYYFGLSYKGFELKLSQTLTDFFGVNSKNPPINWSTKKIVRPNGHSYHSPYLEANYIWKFYPKWTAAFHFGYQGVTNYSELNYVDGQITLAREFEWFDVFVYYVATNAKRDFYDVPDDAFKPHKKKLGAPEVVVGVGRAF